VDRIGFDIRIDPRQRGNVDPFFSAPGTYRFVMQISAPDVEEPTKLTFFADWNGQNLEIRSDSGEVLETASVLKA
jgi:hypothetical protein